MDEEEVETGMEVECTEEEVWSDDEAEETDCEGEGMLVITDIGIEGRNMSVEKAGLEESEGEAEGGPVEVEEMFKFSSPSLSSSSVSSVKSITILSDLLLSPEDPETKVPKASHELHAIIPPF